METYFWIEIDLLSLTDLVGYFWLILMILNVLLKIRNEGEGRSVGGVWDEYVFV
jgi:hypothetical protein